MSYDAEVVPFHLETNFFTELNGKMLLGVLGDQMATDISGALDNNNQGGGTFYFFSRLKEPSIARLKRAFGIKSDIPKILQDTSFQGEVIVGSTSNSNGTLFYYCNTPLADMFLHLMHLIKSKVNPCKKNQISRSQNAVA